jgi:predicted dehydrogenase
MAVIKDYIQKFNIEMKEYDLSNKGKQFNVIIIGNGSIGKRHAKNLTELGYRVRTVDIDEIDHIDEIIKYEKYCQVLPPEKNILFGIVCTPTYLHLDHCIKLAEHGIDFLCEKPLYSEKDEQKMKYLKRLIYEHSLIDMVACNIRFNKSVKNIPLKLIEKSSYIKVKFGYDLRKWHNDGKHLKLYSANKSMGGGILLDAIHEPDIVFHFYGNIKSVDLHAYKKSTITIDTEDYVNGQIIFENGKTIDMELDYLAEDYTRFIEFDHKYKYNIIPDNEMYVDELKYYIHCIKTKRRTFNTIEDSEYLIDKLLNGTKYHF